MSSPPSSATSRRRTFDLPKSSPDAGLAEWTSRIKAIQQEVDRDEESEYRRLQEEITRSRMERAKRRNTATGSIDWSKRATSPSSDGPDIATSVADTQQHQADALKKLAGSSSPPRLPLGSPAHPTSTSAPSRTKPESVSLAAFMGGRATGPKFNKHAPQQDAHDPTMFDQTRREGPHPVFGRANEIVGNFAPPAVQRSGTNVGGPKIQLDSKVSESGIPVASPAPVVLPKNNDATKSPPAIPTKPTIFRKTSDTADANQDVSPSTRSRTPPSVSSKPVLIQRQSQDQVPSSYEPSRPLPSLPVHPNPTSLAEMIGGRASGSRLNKQPSREGTVEPSVSSSSGPNLALQGRQLPGMGSSRLVSPPFTSPPNLTSTSPQSIPSRPLSQQALRSDASSPISTFPQKRSFSGPKVVTPSLARPVQPQVIVQPSPVAASSVTASPAFLRAAPSTQELHPSLSRLKGRGFVEQRVKASSELFGGTKPQPRERSTSAGSSVKRPTVLDRWQPIASTPSSPPLSSAPNTPSRKVVMADATSTGSPPRDIQQTAQPRASSPAFVEAKVEQAKQDVAAPVRLPGMALVQSLPKLLAQHGTAEELRPLTDRGVVKNGPAERIHDKTGSTAPLNHPTRDRARKPRKAQGASKIVSTTVPLERRTPPLEATVEEPQTIGDQPLTAPLPPAADRTTQHEESLRRTPSPELKRQISPTVETNIGRLKDALTYKPPTDPKQHIAPCAVSDAMNLNGVNSASAQDRRALPGMAVTSLPASDVPRAMTPVTSSSSPEEAPLSLRHSRIPSTGQRATVMDVAQALQEHEQHIRESSFTPEPEPEPDPELPEVPDTVPPTLGEGEPDETPRTDVKAGIAGWSRNISSGVQHAERRRSTYDRYSVTTLPPLAEEKTPAATPQGSLSRGFAQVEQTPSVQDIYQSLKAREPEGAPAVVETRARLGEPLVHFEQQDRPPPAFNLQSVLREKPYSPDSNSQIISVEVLSIAGHTATAIVREPNVFYDSEVLAIVCREKEKNNGLVSTQIWAWHGGHAESGEREDHKVQELAGRFGTTGTHCVQGSEPPELIHVLGGVLAIRQGTRVHWTVENTAMHKVISIGDSIFVDEVDLAISNLCSAYSYCISVLDVLYVWHGRGSEENLRKIASAYAQSLTQSPTTGGMSISEFEEGTEDEVFWMMLGDDGFANADYWKFKQKLDRLGARLFTIDSSKFRTPVRPVANFSGQDLCDKDVFVVDCRLEVFVIIGLEARGKRTDIQLALFVAENISAAVAAQRPFDPPIHVVIIPSRLPLELRAAIRLCDEEKLNGGAVPNHMNLLSHEEALCHLQQRSWPKSALADRTFLPLGISPDML